MLVTATLCPKLLRFQRLVISEFDLAYVGIRLAEPTTPKNKRRLFGKVSADGLAHVHVVDPCRVRPRSLALEVGLHYT